MRTNVRSPWLSWTSLDFMVGSLERIFMTWPRQVAPASFAVGERVLGGIAGVGPHGVESVIDASGPRVPLAEHAVAGSLEAVRHGADRLLILVDGIDAGSPAPVVIAGERLD